MTKSANILILNTQKPAKERAKGVQKSGQKPESAFLRKALILNTQKPAMSVQKTDKKQVTAKVTFYSIKNGNINPQTGSAKTATNQPDHAGSANFYLRSGFFNAFLCKLLILNTQKACNERAKGGQKNESNTLLNDTPKQERRLTALNRSVPPFKVYFLRKLLILNTQKACNERAKGGQKSVQKRAYLGLSFLNPNNLAKNRVSTILSTEPKSKETLPFAYSQTEAISSSITATPPTIISIILVFSLALIVFSWVLSSSSLIAFCTSALYFSVSAILSTLSFTILIVSSGLSRGFISLAIFFKSLIQSHLINIVKRAKFSRIARFFTKIIHFFSRQKSGQNTKSAFLRKLLILNTQKACNERAKGGQKNVQKRAYFSNASTLFINTTIAVIIKNTKSAVLPIRLSFLRRIYRLMPKRNAQAPSKLRVNVFSCGMLSSKEISSYIIKPCDFKKLNTFLMVLVSVFFIFTSVLPCTSIWYNKASATGYKFFISLVFLSISLTLIIRHYIFCLKPHLNGLQPGAVFTKISNTLKHTSNDLLNDTPKQERRLRALARFFPPLSFFCNQTENKHFFKSVLLKVTPKQESNETLKKYFKKSHNFKLGN